MKKAKVPFTVADLSKRQQRKVVRNSFKETSGQMMQRLTAGAKNPRRVFKLKETDELMKAPKALPINLLIKARAERLKEEQKKLDEKKA